MITADEALTKLKEGNRRFLSGSHQLTQNLSESHRLALSKGQKPFAVILSCSDSRVAPEIIFDQGLGDLFIVRVAGAIATPTQIGSAEFSAAEFGSPLVVVLGHSQCGAVKATLGAIKSSSKSSSPHIQSLIDQLEPSIQTCANKESLPGVIEHTVKNVVNQLKKESLILSKVKVIGATYSLETGDVKFLGD